MNNDDDATMSIIPYAGTSTSMPFSWESTMTETRDINTIYLQLQCFIFPPLSHRRKEVSPFLAHKYKEGLTKYLPVVTPTSLYHNLHSHRVRSSLTANVLRRLKLNILSSVF